MTFALVLCVSIDRGGGVQEHNFRQVLYSVILALESPVFECSLHSQVFYKCEIFFHQ